MTDKLAILLELEKRGTLPPDKKAMLAEARKRGLVPPLQEQAGPNAEPPAGLAPGSQEPVHTDEAGHIVPDNPMAQGTPAPEGPAATFQDISDNLSAGFTAGVNAVPIAGPAALSGLERVKAAVQGRNADDVAETDRAQVEQHPEAAAVGTVAGTVLPFMAGGEVPVIAKSLGMTGPLLERAGFGLASSGIIGTADAAARGEKPEDIAKTGALSAAIGAGLPALGALGRIFAGKMAPKEIQNIARAMEHDDIRPSEVNKLLKKAGPDSMVMDLGPNLQQQAGAVASIPGKGQKILRDAIDQRAERASDRVGKDVENALGTGPEAHVIRDAIVDAQSAAAKPLYDAVRDVPITVPPVIGNILKTPLGRDALAQAERLAANDGVADPKAMTVGLADYMKRALDDVASSAARAGNNNAARQASVMARTLTNAVDKVVPAYKTAREAFAGPAKVLDALDRGGEVFAKDMSPGQLHSVLRSMSPSERDAFLQGARSQVEALMGNAVNDVVVLRNLFRRGYNAEKLRILLGPKAADALQAGIRRELAHGETANAVARNSETARRSAAQAEVAPELGKVPKISTTWTGIALSAFDAARAKISGITQPATNAAMAGIHTATSLTPAQVRALEAAPTAGKGIVAPVAPALLAEPERRQPIEITIHGGT